MATKPKVEVKVEKEAEVEEPQEFKFYRSLCNGLRIVLADSPNGDPTLVESVRFVPYMEKWQGDSRKVGYLKTDDPRVFARLEGDYNVTEITEKEYEDGIDLSIDGHQKGTY